MENIPYNRKRAAYEDILSQMRDDGWAVSWIYPEDIPEYIDIDEMGYQMVQRGYDYMHGLEPKNSNTCPNCGHQMVTGYRGHKHCDVCGYHD